MIKTDSKGRSRLTLRVSRTLRGMIEFFAEKNNLSLNDAATELLARGYDSWASEQSSNRPINTFPSNKDTLHPSAFAKMTARMAHFNHRLDEATALMRKLEALLNPVEKSEQPDNAKKTIHFIGR